MKQPQPLPFMLPNAEERVWPPLTPGIRTLGGGQRKRREGRKPHLSHAPYGAVGISFLLLMILLVACGGFGTSSVEEEESLSASATMPHYEIEFTLSDDLTFLQGSAHIRVPNTSADPWTYLVFRLYPALEHYGGEFRIQNAAVEGSTAPFTYLEQNTAVRVELPRALLRGQTTTVYLSWRLEIPHWSAGYGCGLPPVRVQSGILEPTAHLPLAGRLSAGADRGERTLVAGAGHQPRRRGFQLHIPICCFRHSADRSDSGDERQPDHLHSGQCGAGATSVGDGIVARIFHPPQQSLSIRQPGRIR